MYNSWSAQLVITVPHAAASRAGRPGRQRQRDPSDQRNNTRPLMQHPARSRPERRITTRSCTDSSTFADRSTRYPRRTYRRSTALSPRDAHIRARGRPGRAASWPPAAFPSRPAARLWQLPLLGCRCVGQLGWLILRRSLARGLLGLLLEPTLATFALMGELRKRGLLLAASRADARDVVAA
jgi:hypothetical protein